MQLSLIVNTYNQPEFLAKIFSSLAIQTRLPDEIVVADDGSSRDTAVLVQRWQRKFKIPLRHVWHEKDGFRRAAILNKAITVCTGDYIVFTDGDCVLDRRFISNHHALAQRGVWVQGRRCYVRLEYVSEFEIGETLLWSWVLRGRIAFTTKFLHLPVPLWRRDRSEGGVMGCNMAFWLNDLLAVNGFDEDYTGWGCEDKDLACRMYHLGLERKRVKHQAILFHLDHPLLSRENLAANEARLQATRDSGVIRCKRGLDQHLSGAKLESDTGCAVAVKPASFLSGGEQWQAEPALFSSLSR